MGQLGQEIMLSTFGVSFKIFSSMWNAGSIQERVLFHPGTLKVRVQFESGCNSRAGTNNARTVHQFWRFYNRGFLLLISLFGILSASKASSKVNGSAYLRWFQLQLQRCHTHIWISESRYVSIITIIVRLIFPRQFFHPPWDGVSRPLQSRNVSARTPKNGFA